MWFLSLFLIIIEKINIKFYFMEDSILHRICHRVVLLYYTKLVA